MPKNDDLSLKSPLGPEQRDHQTCQELQTIDHPAADYPIRGGKPLRMKFSVGTRLQKLELNRSTGLLLDDDRSRTNLVADDKVADLGLDDVASSQLAVDREIKQCAVPEQLLAIQVEPDCPYLRRFKCTLGTHLPSRVPRLPILGAGVIYRMSHRVSPF